jgi:hypothetical protein
VGAFLNSFLVEIAGAIVALVLSLVIKNEKWKLIILFSGAILVVGLLANKSQTEQSVANSLNGIWIGEVYQENLDIWYSTVLTLENCQPDNLCGSVSYPDLQCGGSLKLDEGSPVLIKLTEQITYGNPRCKDGVLITLEWIEGTTWQASYIADEELVAEARLTRDH